MSSQKVARSKLADVLADIKNSRAEDEYDYNLPDSTPAPSKRRVAVNYVALSGHTPRQSRSNSSHAISASQNNTPSSKTGQTTPGTQVATNRNQTYMLKLYDRPIDLAQFTKDESYEERPLYPVCRAWINGHKTVQPTQPKSAPKLSVKLEKGEGSPGASQPDTSSDTITEVNSMPPPKRKLDAMKDFNLELPDESTDIRIPISVREFKRPENVEETFDKSIETMQHYECLELNKNRWKKVRSDWAEARRVYESRYSESFKILKDMFMTAQRGV